MSKAMILWRIATDTPTYRAHDLNGDGAKITGGRWNSKGKSVVYASSSIALACLETLVHLGNSLPFNRYLVQISVPPSIWNKRIQWDQTSVPVGWDAEPAGIESLSLGDTWLKDGKSAIAVVPSVLVPEEFNVLINPNHPDAPKITSTKVRKWLYDSRMIK